MFWVSVLSLEVHGRLFFSFSSMKRPAPAWSQVTAICCLLDLGMRALSSRSPTSSSRSTQTRCTDRWRFWQTTNVSTTLALLPQWGMEAFHGGYVCWWSVYLSTWSWTRWELSSSTSITRSTSGNLLLVVLCSEEGHKDGPWWGLWIQSFWCEWLLFCPRGLQRRVLDKRHPTA